MNILALAEQNGSLSGLVAVVAIVLWLAEMHSRSQCQRSADAQSVHHAEQVAALRRCGEHWMPPVMPGPRPHKSATE